MDTSRGLIRSVAWCVATLVCTAAWAQGSPPTTLALKSESDLGEGLDPVTELDRSTPQRTWDALLRSCRDGQPQVGAHLLNLGDVPRNDRKVLGLLLARQLCAALQASGKLVPLELDDSPLGPLVDNQPANYVSVVRLDLPNGPEELWLRRVHDTKTDQHLWLVTRQSVSLIQGWYRTLILKDATRRADVGSLNSGLGPMPQGLQLASPRDAVREFLRLARGEGLQDAARLLDLSNLEPERQPEEGRRLARRLSLVLKRLRADDPRLLSNSPQGAPEQDVAMDEEVIARASVDEGHPVLIRLVRHPHGTGGAWLFSADTVGQIDLLYQRLGYSWAGDHLPPVFFEFSLAGVLLWQWLGILAALVLGLGIGWLGATLLRRLAQSLAGLTSWSWDDRVARLLRGPLTLLVWAVAYLGLLVPLSLDDGPLGVLQLGAKLLAIVGGGWLMVRLVDVAADALADFFKDRKDALATSMVPVFRKVLKPILWAVVVIVALQNAGMNVAGLLAGLGIGGLALALAGKPTLENLFGSIAIAFDRPFRIGDFVKVGDFLGTIEDVGLRSTRIRTLDRTLVTIPNSQMADSKVENYTVRDRMRLLAELGVEYDTTLDQLRLALDEIKRYLLARSDVADGFSVRFIGYGSSALRIEVFCYVTTSDWGVFTGAREQILMDLGDILSRLGIAFAFPTQTLYMAKVREGQSEHSLRATALVEERRRAGELCLPEIPEAVRRKVVGE